MKQILLLTIATCLLFVSCKKDKQSEYYKALILQGGNHCDKGTWIQFDRPFPISSSSSDYSDKFNVTNLPETDNIPGKTISVKFTYDQSGTICTAMWQSYPSIVLTDVE